MEILNLSAHIRYIRPRNGVFQYERRVPNAVKIQQNQFSAIFNSRPLFRVSLRTKDQLLALEAGAGVHRQFDALVAEALGDRRPVPSRMLSVRPVTVLKRKVTDADLSSIADQFCDRTAYPFERAHVLADMNVENASYLQQLYHDLELDAEALREVVRGHAGNDDAIISTPVDAAKAIVEEQQFDAMPGTPEFAHIVGAVRSGYERGFRKVGQLQSGEIIPSMTKKAQPSPAKAGLTIREAVDRYQAHLNPSSKMASEVRLSLNIFESVVGNKPLDCLTREDFQTYVTHLAGQQVGGKTPGSIKRPASAGTVKKRMGILNAAINHADHRGWFTGRNPASNIKIASFVQKVDKSVMPDKRRFTIGEVNKILRHPWFTGCKSPTQIHTPGTFRLKGCHFWAPILALLTGCRVGEIGGLKLSDIKLGDPSPHFQIAANEFRRIKNGTARNVPILDCLLQVGFAEFVEDVRQTGAIRLFPDWLPPKRIKRAENDDDAWSNSRLIRAFNRTVISAALGDELPTNARSPVTFHSFRGCFKAMLYGNEYHLSPNIVHEVVGHAKSELDTRYIGSIPIEETYPAVRGCAYRDLVLPVKP